MQEAKKKKTDLENFGGGKNPNKIRHHYPLNYFVLENEDDPPDTAQDIIHLKDIVHNRGSIRAIKTHKFRI